MDIHFTNTSSNSWEVVFVTKKIRQLFSKHRVSQIVSMAWWRAVIKEKM